MDGPRWTEEVDDLVDAGDVDGAIALLESVVSDLSTSAAPPATDLRLATALGDLAGLHASRGDTLRADELRARAIALRSRATVPGTGTLGIRSCQRNVHHKSVQRVQKTQKSQLILIKAMKMRRMIGRLLQIVVPLMTH
ncbi:Growth inhibition and differentiation-related protein 88-like protein [Zea mays]|uniref:Growth inhibition and differentiation-related protein 88-like protein n=1 Tax=Zea mays TaxID=4577 RepID=A0A1D6LYK6_MAIZE|nr:Growth inhibition and differentiation-related protein 88-like protein [Zea mays]